MLEQAIFNIRSSEEFQNIALEVFRFQYDHVPTYRAYCDLRKVQPKNVDSIEDIPFLPIQFFKNHQICAQGYTPELVFSSSGTTGSTPSKHFVAKRSMYEESFFRGFESVYGAVNDYVILALLPSYLEREGSSLIYMINSFIERSNHNESGFFLRDHSTLVETIKSLENKGQKSLLIGVSFALLDLVADHTLRLQHTTVMETGGMKGRRKEMVRAELHDLLSTGFGASKIHSEYGMTELLSQAYSKGDGVFKTPSWMAVRTRDTENPLEWVQGTTGGVNIIDLANLYSCSFIETQDLGRVHRDGSFEILGRFDTSDIRGCNLMML